jgi:hypothetical protein
MLQQKYFKDLFTNEELVSVYYYHLMNKEIENA